MSSENPRTLIKVKIKEATSNLSIVDDQIHAKRQFFCMRYLKCNLKMGRAQYKLQLCFIQAENEESTITGALFLAVCRGKVSEGLDFANNNARAVVAVSFMECKNAWGEIACNNC